MFYGYAALPSFKRLSAAHKFGLMHLAVALAGLVTALTPATSATAHESPALRSQLSAVSQRAHALTQALAMQSQRLPTASTAERRRLEENLLAIAATRRQLLLALIESDPEAVLQLTIPNSVRAMLPAQVSSLLETETLIEGTLEIMHEDSAAGARYQYGVHSSGKRYLLFFAGNEPSHLLSGARIRVHGIRLDSMLALAGGGNNIQTITDAPVQSRLGEQRALVILVNFSDNASQPYTRDDVRNVVFGATSQFLLENSSQQTWLAGDVAGWFTIPLSANVCDTGTLANEALSAAVAAGVDVSVYNRRIYIFPKNACGFSGAAYIGGSPSHAWINGSLKVRTLAHELGHNLGLWHSHAFDCGTEILASTCSSLEYGDVMDTMGGPIGTSFASHYNAFQKERLGWLNAGVSPSITTVLKDGSYPLETYEAPGFGPKALKILKSTDPSTGQRSWYYVESRQAIGFDDFLATNALVAGETNVPRGILVRYGSESSGDTSNLINFTPATSEIWDVALTVGQTFSDSDIIITPTSVTSTGAVVTVRFASVAAPTNSTTAPAVIVSTDRPIYTRIQAATVMVTVMVSGSPVAGAPVMFTITKPSGTTVVANGITGSDGRTSYRLRLKKQDPVGTYTVTAVATANGQSARAATNFLVQ